MQPATTAEIRQALLTLNTGLPSSLQAVLVDSLRQEQALGDRAFQGLSYSQSSAHGSAAVWLQVLPGHTGVLWPPDCSHPLADELLAASARFADEHSLQLVQFLVSPDEQLDERIDEALLAKHDINRLVTLEYLWIDPTACDNIFENCTDASVDSLTFLPHANQHPERLAELIARTYIDTQDCPALNHVRDLDAVIAGYEVQGTMLPEHWTIVQQEEAAGKVDIGVLILASHPHVGSEFVEADSKGNWELVYMGIVPGFRGRGLSRQIVSHAIQQAAQSNVQRLVLAVDADNEPAKRVYLSAGFQVWQRRVVYARLCPKT